MRRARGTATEVEATVNLGPTELIIIFAIFGMPLAIIAVVVLVVRGSTRRSEQQVHPLPPAPSAPPPPPPGED